MEILSTSHGCSPAEQLKDNAMEMEINDGSSGGTCSQRVEKIRDSQWLWFDWFGVGAAEGRRCSFIDGQGGSEQCGGDKCWSTAALCNRGPLLTECRVAMNAVLKMTREVVRHRWQLGHRSG
jgi:hypothetical protein